MAIKADTGKDLLNKKTSLENTVKHFLKLNTDRLLVNAARAPSRKDPESIHNIRVASRRLLNLIRIFDRFLDKKISLKIAQGLRSILKTAGAVRELEIIKTTLSEYALKRANDPRVDLILRIIKIKLKASYKKLYPALRGPGLRNTLELLLHEQENIIVESTDARKFVKRALKRASKKVFKYKKHCYKLKEEDLHSLRIALKRLRYTIEFLSHYCGKDTPEEIDKIIELQDILGKFHDCAVIIDMLTDIKHGIARQSAKEIIALESKSLKKNKKLFRKKWCKFPDSYGSFTDGILC